MSHIIDILFLVIIGFTVFKNYRAGFIKSAFYLGRLLLTFVITSLLGPLLSDVIVSAISEEGGALASVFSYVILFIAVYIGLTVLANLLSEMVEKSIFAVADKLLGAALGLVGGILLCSFITAVLYGYVYLTGDMTLYENSVLFKFFHDVNIFGFIAEKISSIK